MISKNKAYALRALIEQASVSLSDEDALNGVELFPHWNGEGFQYETNDRVSYDNILYKCLQGHISQPTWNPVDSPSLWAEVLIPDEDEIYEWKQPDSTNPYMKGDKVRHNEKIWESIIDNNVWEPSVYGWNEVV